MNVSSSGRLAGTVATVCSIRWTTITSRRYTVGGINNVSKSIHDFVGIVKTIDRMRKAGIGGNYYYFCTYFGDS